jgi:hypothetical protein
MLYVSGSSTLRNYLQFFASEIHATDYDELKYVQILEHVKE